MLLLILFSIVAHVQLTQSSSKERKQVESLYNCNIVGYVSFSNILSCTITNIIVILYMAGLDRFDVKVLSLMRTRVHVQKETCHKKFNEGSFISV